MNIHIYNNGEYIGKMEGSTENIAHLIGGAEPTDNYRLVDNFDNLVVSSIGFFLDRVPDQEWLKRELLPLIQQIQFNLIPLKRVKIKKERKI